MPENNKDALKRLIDKILLQRKPWARGRPTGPTIYPKCNRRRPFC